MPKKIEYKGIKSELSKLEQKVDSINDFVKEEKARRLEELERKRKEEAERKRNNNSLWITMDLNHRFFNLLV